MGAAETCLDQQEKVRVLALGGGALTLLDVVLLNVNTLHNRSVSSCPWSCGRAKRRAHHLAVALAAACWADSTNGRSRVAAVADELASSKNKVSAKVAQGRRGLATGKHRQTACKLEPPWCVGVAFVPVPAVADCAVVPPFAIFASV